tara:strand:- start:702 stop:902 length:201 start_codon:yes stop_codon:yes gene_type:complete
MERKFEKGDLVTLTNPDYRDIKKGTLGIVMEPINKRRYLMNVWIDGQSWSFPEHEFAHTCDYKDKK